MKSESIRTGLKLPPKRYPRTLDVSWEIADPFQEKFHLGNANRDFTALGALAECYAWWYKNRTPECEPMLATARKVLMRECPIYLAEFELRYAKPRRLH